MLKLKSVNLKTGSFVAISVLTLAASAHAYMIGRNIKFARERDNPAVCEIDISNYDGHGNPGKCTGTLVASDKVFTAGHCFGRNFVLRDHTVDVSCGGSRMGRAIQMKGPDSSNDGAWINNREPQRTEDFAVLTLPPAVDRRGNPIPHETSPVASGPELYFDSQGALLAGVKCKALGYGTTDLNGPEVSSDGVPNIGNLVEGDLKDVIIQYVSSQHMIQTTPRGTQYLATSCGAGDSGGPLFCQAPGHPFELIATIVLRQHAHSIDDSDYVLNQMNPVWFHVQ